MPRRKSETPVSKRSRKTAGEADDVEDWRSAMLDRVRTLIRQADPEVVEELKWRKPANGMAGVPVWSHSGILCTGETYQDKVKLTFAKGASLDDPAGLFNASLDGNTRRAIDLYENDNVNSTAFKTLIKNAVALNTGAKAKASASRARSKTRKGQGTVLLSGGNPQVAKADGDAPVQKYIAAITDWKRDAAKRLDVLIERTVPDVRKAVRWNTPFYGVDGQGWFLGYHCFTKYLKVTFLNGSSLRPPPPVTSKHAATRYFHIHEHDTLNEKQLVNWIEQAAKLPGEPLF